MMSYLHNGAFISYFELLSTLAPYRAAKINLYSKNRIYISYCISFQNLQIELMVSLGNNGNHFLLLL